MQSDSRVDTQHRTPARCPANLGHSNKCNQVTKTHLLSRIPQHMHARCIAAQLSAMVGVNGDDDAISAASSEGSVNASSSPAVSTSSLVAPRRGQQPARTDEQRARRQALRAERLARKQVHAAALREQKAQQQSQRAQHSETAPAEAETKADGERGAEDEDDAAADAAADWADGSGTAVYGNFHRYYSFNPPHERLQFLTPAFLQRILNTDASREAQRRESASALSPLPKCECPSSSPFSLPSSLPSLSANCPPAIRSVRILDLGCNEGDLTMQLMAALQRAADNQQLEDRQRDSRIILEAAGIDIDAELIRRARLKHDAAGGRTLESLAAIDPSSLSESPRCPVFVSFYQANLVCSRTVGCLSESRCELCCCFSLLMWLHLCYGSELLSAFLSCVARLCCHLVVEWQPWRHYRAAIDRRRKESRRGQEVWKWADIQPEWRGEEGRQRLVELLQAEGMTEVAVLGKTRWGREIIWFAHSDS
jgi:hypothetical protein